MSFVIKKCSFTGHHLVKKENMQMLVKLTVTFHILFSIYD